MCTRNDTAKVKFFNGQNHPFAGIFFWWNTLTTCLKYYILFSRPKKWIDNFRATVPSTPQTHIIPSDLLICSSFNSLDLHYVVGFQAVIGYRDRPESGTYNYQRFINKSVSSSLEKVYNYNSSEVWIWVLIVHICNQIWVKFIYLWQTCFELRNRLWDCLGK